MDCIICYKMLLKKVEFSNSTEIYFPSLLCKLLEIPNSSNIQEILQDLIICERCHLKMEEADKIFAQIEELQTSIDKIRMEMLKDLNYSKDVSQVMKNSYGGQMSKSSLNRLKLFEEMGKSGEKNNVEKDEDPIILCEIEKPKEINIEAKRQKPRAMKRKSLKKFHYSMHFYCKICKGRYSSKASRSRHMESHGVKQIQKKLEKSSEISNSSKFSCLECGKTHKSEEDLKTHLENALTSNEIQKCSHCREEFWSILCLKHHFKSHSVVTNKSFSSGSQESNKLVNRKWKCSICHKKFLNRDNLGKHEVIHGPKKIKCLICEKLFHRDDTLKSHIQNVHDGLKKRKKRCLSPRGSGRFVEKGD